MDPEGPVPGVGDGGMLTDLDDEAIDELIAGTVGAPILSTEGGNSGAPSRERPPTTARSRRSKTRWGWSGRTTPCGERVSV